ncbi:MAG: hypothetical protein KatS3mg061_2655 [Dehalococcoidia bacterium]|nr:MAG: hypothetical protein KatS3mg061_2655 [Dehalococcoidia bacterium]
MMPRSLLGGMVAALVLLAGSAAAMQAHPLGNFTVNRLSLLELEPGRVVITHILDMAEIPTLQTRQAFDRNRDNELSADELASGRDQLAEYIRQHLRLKVGDQLLPLSLRSTELSFPTGQGGLLTLRLESEFVAELPARGGRQQGTYADLAFADRLGYVDVLVRARDGVGLLATTASRDDPTDWLQSYPDDALTSPRTVSQVEFTFEGGATSLVEPVLAPVRRTTAAAQDAFAALIATETLTPAFVLLALLTALGLGAVHALSPGHGKTVVGAYLVGSRGTAWHALFLGATVTLTHTVGVFVLGFVTLFLSTFILPERLYPWLELISGVLVVVIGLSLIRQRLAFAFPRLFGRQGRGQPVHALTEEDDPEHARLHAAGIAHHHHSGGWHVHSHGGVPHSHLPPGADGARVSWRSLLTLGISGGLMPCPSALVVMLSAIALGRVAFGILLIVFFSLGLAGVLTGLGLLLVYARRWFNRLPGGRSWAVLRLLPLVSAAVVLLLGLAITLNALGTTRLI